MSTSKGKRTPGIPWHPSKSLRSKQPPRLTQYTGNCSLFMSLTGDLLVSSSKNLPFYYHNYHWLYYLLWPLKFHNESPSGCDFQATHISFLPVPKNQRIGNWFIEWFLGFLEFKACQYLKSKGIYYYHTIYNMLKNFQNSEQGQIYISIWSLWNIYKFNLIICFRKIFFWSYFQNPFISFITSHSHFIFEQKFYYCTDAPDLLLHDTEWISKATFIPAKSCSFKGIWASHWLQVGLSFSVNWNSWTWSTTV